LPGLRAPGGGAPPPHGVAGTSALLVAIGGFFVAVRSAFVLLRSRHVSLDADPQALMRQLARDGALHDVDAFNAAMIARLGRNARATAELLDELDHRFTAMLYGIHVMLCGLALAALVG
jgi:hypothetical protein